MQENSPDKIEPSAVAPLAAGQHRFQHLLVWALFLISGACGLIYEVLWCRQLGLIFGNTVHSLSAVLTAFMGGLALGSFVAGRLCHRIRRPLFVYGVLEILIGVYCALLPWVFSDRGPLVPLYQSLYGESGSSSLVAARFAVSFILLLIPTTFMGATLPVLSLHQIRRDRRLGRTVGTLYALNSFGAVLGALGTGFLLLPELGKLGTNYTAVAANLILGAIAVFFGAREVHDDSAAPEQTIEGSATRSGVQVAVLSASVSPVALKLAVVTFAITGFAAMATQIGWTRAISLCTGSSTYAFSLIVSVFILGLSAGGWWGSRIAPRLLDPVAMLARILVSIGLFNIVIAALLGFAPLLFFFLIAWGSASSWSVLMLLQALGIGLLIIGPTFLMGATLPLTMQIAARSSTDAGRTVGTIYAVNTVGAILGSFFGGLVLLPLLNIQRTLEFTALLYAIPGAALFMFSASRRDKRAVFGVTGLFFPIVLLLLLSPPWDSRLMSSGIYLLRDQTRLQAARELRFLDALPGLGKAEDLLYYKEGATATVAVIRVAGGHLSLSVGGKPDATSYGDMTTQIGLTLLPCVLHSSGAQEVLVIGMGSGVSAGAALAPDTVKRVDVVEMAPEVIEAAALFGPFNEIYDAKTRQLNTPKVEVQINDGRNHLLLTSRRYDVIASEPSNPWMAGVGNLFTREAFELSKSRLKPGGIMCQWLHSYALQISDFNSIIHTFAQVFPHAQLWFVNKGDFVLIGSETPLDIPAAKLRERLAQPGIKRWLNKVHFDTPAELLACYICGGDKLREKVRNAALHTDDNMMLEFSAPQSLYAGTAPILGTQFLPVVEQALKFDLPPAENAALQAEVDLAVLAREHLRFAIETPSAYDLNMQAAHRLAPYQTWALDWRNKADELRAHDLLSGRAGDKSAADPAAAVELLRATRARTMSVHWQQSLLDHALMQLVEYQLAQRKPAEALATLTEVTASYRPEKVQLVRARTFAELQQIDKALDAVNKASEAGAHPLECADWAGRIQVLAGRPLDALATVELVLAAPQAQTDPLAAPLWLMRADLLQAMGKFENAQAAAELAVRLTNGDLASTRLLSTILGRQGKLPQAAPLVRRLLALDPLNPAPRVDFAAVLSQLAQNLPPDKAADALELLRYARMSCRMAVTLDPRRAAGWEMLTRCYHALAKADAALSEFYKQQAQQALAKALELHNGDRSKLPQDLQQD